MFTLNVDLGQIILSVLIGIIGWFMKRTIDSLGKRLDRHDEILIGLVGDVQRLIGQVGASSQ